MGQNGLINFEHNEANYRKDDYYWFMYNQKILENKIIEEKGYSTLFLTLTLPSSYHKFSKTTKRYNPKFDENENPIYNEFGKVAKSERYVPPDLTPFIYK